MSLFNVGLTLDSLGKILLGVTVLMVHRHVLKEHKIGTQVLGAMRGEQALGILGIILITAGYILQLIYHV